MRVDALIFGGGVAGLWLLDELRQRGCNPLLLEAGRLGQGQTVASQGIIHGGLKYTLQGIMTRSATNIREMPGVWRSCLAGQRRPNLSRTRIRAQSCCLWRTDSVSSRLGMIGARIGLRVAPQTLSVDERPEVLRDCPGTVARLDEQVISTPSMLESLAAPHRGRILKLDFPGGCQFEWTLTEADGPRVTRVLLSDSATGRQLELQPALCVFTAGGGNAALREACGLSSQIMQRRPLHQVLVRGPHLPRLNGHCVDGASTRVTVTSDIDQQGRTVWQLGGQVAELGTSMDAVSLARFARSELEAAIPGIDLTQTEWSTYRVDRAEGLDAQGRRPESARVLREGNILTIWPTKLALAPLAALSAIEQMRDLAPQRATTADDARLLEAWPKPEVACAPWDETRDWFEVPSTTPAGRRAA